MARSYNVPIRVAQPFAAPFEAGRRTRLELAGAARLNYVAFLTTLRSPGAASMEINALQNQLKDLGARALSLRGYL